MTDVLFLDMLQEERTQPHILGSRKSRGPGHLLSLHRVSVTLLLPLGRTGTLKSKAGTFHGYDISHDIYFLKKSIWLLKH